MISTLREWTPRTSDGMVAIALRGAPGDLRTFVLAVGAAAAMACTASDAAVPAGATAVAAPSTSRATTGTVRTWYRDVEPIVQRECTGCHVTDGTGGFPLDRATSVSLASFLADIVATRRMPPWPPSDRGAPLVLSRALDRDSIATIAEWAAAGAPEGDPRDHAERAPRITSVTARPPDLALLTSEAEAYQAPSNPFVTDEVRCFVLDLPAGHDGIWVGASRWRAGTPRGVHNLGGMVVGPQAAALAHARSGRDGRAGFECGGGLGDIATGPALSASGTGGGGDGGSSLPAGTAVRIPAGGAVVMRVHYAVKHLGGVSDRSGVELWLAGDKVRPVVLGQVAAPVEVPCPTGVSLDPASPCSRDNAFARLAAGDVPATRARADALLATCGTDLERATKLVVNGDHAFVTTSCAAVASWGGTLRVVEARMHTRGASVTVDVEQSDGTWSTALDVTSWRWGWAGAYVLERGLPVPAGKRIRVSCTFDNGGANQWSALTGEPGHDAPARPPLLGAGYLVAAPNRAAEACEAAVGIERAPYKGLTWPTLCHEAQAVRSDACGTGGSDLTSRGCASADLDASVAILGARTTAQLCALP